MNGAGSEVLKKMVDKLPAWAIIVGWFLGPSALGVGGGYFGGNQALEDRVAKLEVVSNQLESGFTRINQRLDRYEREGRLQTPEALQLTMLTEFRIFRKEILNEIKDLK